MGDSKLVLQKQINYLNKNKVPLSPFTRFENLLFVSGQPPLSKEGDRYVDGDIELQTRLVLDNVKAVLEANGSSLNDVLKTTIFATNAGHYDRINKIYAEYFKDHKPARTFVTVGSFNTAFDLEIECIASVKS